MNLIDFIYTVFSPWRLKTNCRSVNPAGIVQICSTPLHNLRNLHPEECRKFGKDSSLEMSHLGPILAVSIQTRKTSSFAFKNVNSLKAARNRTNIRYCAELK